MGNDVINHKTTKFESNSQPLQPKDARTAGCYQSQNYKIWKQFTTLATSLLAQAKLLSITKLQNLKAIHNYVRHYNLCRWDVINRKTTKFWKQFTTCHLFGIDLKKMLSITKLQNLKAIHNEAGTTLQVVDVVINRKTTKFESNSQPRLSAETTRLGCYQSQNYKIWKQFTTGST